MNVTLKGWHIVLIMGAILLAIWMIILNNQVEHEKDRAYDRCQDDISACFEDLDAKYDFDD